MATKTDTQLATDATQIQNETAANANTASRVGTYLNNSNENKINKDKIVTALGTTDTNVPSEKCVKDAIAVVAATVTPALGFTPENVANKDTDVALTANSDIKYPSQKAVKAYADTKQAALGFPPENVANKSTSIATDTGSNTKYPTVKAVEDAITGQGKIYSGRISQTGTGIPTVATGVNTIGNIVFTRSSIGQYLGTLTGAFTTNKTTITPGSQASFILGKELGIFINTLDDILIICRNSAGAFADINTVDFFSIEIKVYP